MAQSLFKLVGSVFIDTDSANNSLQKTTEKAEKTGTSFGTVASKAAGIGTAVVAGATAAVAGITSLASSAAETADTIDKASIRMGISAEQYQEYAYAAELAGVDTSTLEKAAKALEGTDISFDDAMDQIMALGTAEERSAMAAELFGEKVAYTMSPLIEQSADSFQSAIDEANELGLVMSGDDVKAGAELNDTMTKVQESFQMIATKLGTALMPIIQKVANYIVKQMPKIQSLFDKLAPTLEAVFEELLPPLMDLADQLLPPIMDLITEIVPLISDLASNIIPIIVNVLELLMPIFTQIIEALLPPLIELINALLPIIQVVLDVLSPILDVFMLILDPVARLIEAISPLIEIFVKLIDFALKPLEPILDFLAYCLEYVVGAAFDGITNVIEGAVDVFDWLGEKITDFALFWNDVWTNVGEFFKNIWEGMKEAVKVPLNWIIEKINGVFSALGEIDIPDWVPGIGGQTFSLPQIPTLANGGLVDGGQLFEAREAGPELVGTVGRGTSAVMNNDQIVAAVSQGVAEAVKNVLGDDLAERIAGAIANVSLSAYISSSDVFNAVKKENKSYTKATGRSAFV